MLNTQIVSAELKEAIELGRAPRTNFVQWVKENKDAADRYRDYFEGVEEAKLEHYYRGMMHAYRNVLERLGEPDE